MVSLPPRSRATMDPELQRLLCGGATSDGECLVLAVQPPTQSTCERLRVSRKRTAAIEVPTRSPSPIPQVWPRRIR